MPTPLVKGALLGSAFTIVAMFLGAMVWRRRGGGRRRDWPPRRCRYELPSLARLRASAEDAEVALLCITSESPSDVNRFLESRNLELPGRVICGEIDRTGSVMLRHVGAAKWDDPRGVAFRALDQYTVPDAVQSNTGTALPSLSRAPR